MTKKNRQTYSLTFDCGCGKKHLKTKNIIVVGDTKWKMDCLVTDHYRLEHINRIMNELLEQLRVFNTSLCEKLGITLDEALEEFVEKRKSNNVIADSEPTVDTSEQSTDNTTSTTEENDS